MAMSIQFFVPGALVTKLDEIRPQEKTPEQIEEEVKIIDTPWKMGEIG